MSKLFNQFKKLNRNELDELVKRIEHINGYVLVVQALETQKAFWLSNKVKEKGLDQTKQYRIDFKTGRFIPVVEPPKEEPKDKPE